MFTNGLAQLKDSLKGAADLAQLKLGFHSSLKKTRTIYCSIPNYEQRKGSKKAKTK